MKRYLSLILSCVLVAGCVSEQERRESMYRYEETMRNQCEHTLGFSVGTQGYMNCRMFYDEYLPAAGYSTTSMSFSNAQNIQNQINSLNNQCERYWGTSGISGVNLWNCVQQLGNKVIDEAERQRELKEKEEMLTRSIAEGQKEANNDARLQERIDAERMRVAQQTGKNPKKIYCTTRQSSNGYVKIKCK